eukprot:6208281-Pleurochrysis_carterae.AAC.2
MRTGWNPATTAAGDSSCADEGQERYLYPYHPVCINFHRYLRAGACAEGAADIVPTRTHATPRTTRQIPVTATAWP